MRPSCIRTLELGTEHGGESDVVADAVFVEELARCGSGAVAAGIGAHAGIALPPIAKFGTEEQKQRFLVPGIRGERSPRWRSPNRTRARTWRASARPHAGCRNGYLVKRLEDVHHRGGARRRDRQTPTTMDSARGQLLIAGPGLQDPNFWRTVVLVIEHTEAGAFGLVLNRASETTVADAAPELEEVVDLDAQLFIGGPVAPSAVIVLAEFDDADEAALIAFGDVGVLGSNTSQRPFAGVRSGRAFAGHAGWGPSQLDSELERGDWILEPARRDDAFAADPPGLWTDVLTRKGGSYTLVARMPPDPSVN